MDAVVITGSCGGIGAALCAAFRQAKYFVIASDRRATACDCDAFVGCDLEDLVVRAEVREHTVNSIVKKLDGRELSVLINNAAVQHVGPFETATPAQIVQSVHVNALAPALLTQALMPHLKRKGGSVINIGSIHAEATKPGFAAYAMSKSALRGLTRALAVEIGRDIRVNIIEPAAIATDMLIDGFEDDPEALDRLTSYHPVGRLGTPEDIANLALFLASDRAGFINGAVLGVDGGIRGRLHDPG